MQNEIEEPSIKGATIVISTPTGEIDVADLKEIPSRLFRDAWRLDGKVISIDLSTAREIHKGRMRDARKEQFNRVDAQRAIAMDNDDQDKLAEVKALAQELRDVTGLLALLKATAPTEIDAVWPECLGRRGL